MHHHENTADPRFVGKQIPEPGFAGDDGRADPALTEALAAYDRLPSAQTEEALWEQLVDARLLVPVIAVLGEAEEAGADGLRREKTSDMAVATLELPDGCRGLPAFTSLDALRRWNPEARPAPVPASKAVQAAWSSQADRLLIDLAGPVFYELAGAPLRAVAERRAHRRPLRDPDVVAELAPLLAGPRAVLRAHLLPSVRADARLILIADPELDPSVVAVAVRRFAAALAASELLRIRLDRGLDLVVLNDSPGEPMLPLYERD